MGNANSDKLARNKPPKITKTAKEVAGELGINVETLYAWIRDGIFINSEYIVVPHEKRPRYVFFADSAQRWLARNSRQLEADKPPKRTYNRRATKGKHAKKTGE